MGVFIKIFTMLVNRLAIFIIIGVALLFPYFTFLNVLIPYLLATIMFINFLSIRFETITFFDRSSFGYLLFVLILFPLVLSRIELGMSNELKNGIILAVISPTAIASPVISSFIGGDSKRLIVHLLLVNLLAPLTYGLHLNFTLATHAVIIPFTRIIITIFSLIIIPYLAAQGLKKIYPTIKIPREQVVKRTLFFFLIFCGVSSTAVAIRALPLAKGLYLFSIIFVCALILFGTGYILGKGFKMKKTSALMFGHKNAGLSLWIALSLFGATATIPLVLYIIAHHTINGVLLLLFEKESAYIKKQ